MAENKKSFLFYVDWKDIFLALSKEQRGDLITYLLEYVSDENPSDMVDPVLKMAVIPIKAQLKRDLKKWIGFVEKQSFNGKKGGRPQTQKTQAFSEKPKKAVTVTDTVTVNVKETDTVKEVYRSFAHLSINTDEVSKLLDLGFTQAEIDEILDAIQNFKKNNKYTSLYLTARKWLKDDKNKKELGLDKGSPIKKLSAYDKAKAKLGLTA